MKIHLLLLLLLALCSVLAAQDVVVKSPLRFLALGDSYTIGQSVPEKDRWPVQLVTALQSRGVVIDELKIVAQTGWRTDNLYVAMSTLDPNLRYNLVSLLIGVNNQYQGVAISRYPGEFRQLLEKAIDFCNGRKEGVFVLSIPDYGYTPFGSYDRQRISSEIDQYNNINKQIAGELGVAWFNITEISRLAMEKPEYLAGDNLHPSGIMYAKWVELILKSMRIEINTAAGNDISQAVGIQVFPNPATTVINFQLPPQASTLLITNSQGRLLGKWDVSLEETFRLDVSGWSKGMYFYRISSRNQNTHSGKFIVQQDKFGK